MNPYLVATLRSIVAGIGAAAAVLTTTQDWRVPVAAGIGAFAFSFGAHFGGDSGSLPRATA